MKFKILTITMELKILNLNFLNFFLIKLIFFRKQTGNFVSSLHVG